MQPKRPGKCDRCGKVLEERGGFLVCPDVVCGRSYSLPPEKKAAYLRERERRIRLYGNPWTIDGDVITTINRQNQLDLFEEVVQ